jgi:chromosomal replication initiation ATPase DnaA
MPKTMPRTKKEVAQPMPKTISKILRQDAEKRLANVPEEYIFWCCNGSTLRNMKELREAFATMTDEVFAYHANEDRNDFSKWVKDIIRDEKLARDLGKSVKRTQAAKCVAERIVFLSSKLG